jgi:hypothetical protein
MWALISLQKREIPCSGWRYKFNEFIMPSEYTYIYIYIYVIKRC